LAAEAFGDLPAVAEIAQGVAELERLARVEPGVAGGAGAGQDALADAALQLLLQLAGGHGEEEYAHAWTSVRRLPRQELAIAGGLAAAADHRCGKAGHCCDGVARRLRRIGRDDERGRAHGKSFRERVVDAHAVGRQDAHGTSSNGSARPRAAAGTLRMSAEAP